eukprot:3941169-Rhodomonas_salina.2
MDEITAVSASGDGCKYWKVTETGTMIPCSDRGDVHAIVEVSITCAFTSGRSPNLHCSLVMVFPAWR